MRLYSTPRKREVKRNVRYILHWKLLNARYAAHSCCFAGNSLFLLLFWLFLDVHFGAYSQVKTNLRLIFFLFANLKNVRSFFLLLFAWRDIAVLRVVEREKNVWLLPGAFPQYIIFDFAKSTINVLYRNCKNSRK